MRQLQVTPLECIDLGGASMEFIRVPPGTLRIEAQGDEPAATGSQVRAIDVGSFYIARTEVTQRQWRSVMGTDPSPVRGDDLPVAQVSWNDAMAFCVKTGLRLPSGVEWEYACRGGTTTRWSHGEDWDRLAAFAWYRENSGGASHVVAQKLPNPFGLYDVHGNVAEWCDESDERSLGPEFLKWRDYCGGSWISDPLGVASYAWSFETPDYRSKLIGFRPAADAGPESDR